MAFSACLSVCSSVRPLMSVSLSVSASEGSLQCSGAVLRPSSAPSAPTPPVRRTARSLPLRRVPPQGAGHSAIPAPRARGQRSLGAQSAAQPSRPRPPQPSTSRHRRAANPLRGCTRARPCRGREGRRGRHRQDPCGAPDPHEHHMSRSRPTHTSRYRASGRPPRRPDLKGRRHTPPLGGSATKDADRRTQKLRPVGAPGRARLPAVRPDRHRRGSTQPATSARRQQKPRTTPRISEHHHARDAPI